MKRMTMTQLAALAGVDISTVSRALSGDTARVSAATIERVRELAAAHNYQPDAVASSLRRGRSMVIGVLVPALTDVVVATVFEAIAHVSNAAGYLAIVAPTHDSRTQRDAVAASYLGRRVDGVIIADAPARSPLPSAIKHSGIPHVFALRSGGARADEVVADDRLGGSMAGEHLIDGGHRDMCVIGGPRNATTARRRVSGFLGTLENAGITVGQDSIAYGDYGVRSGYEAMCSLLDAGRRPTAVFAVNDFNAIGASRAMKEYGFATGTDVALIGYNDIPLSAHLDVPLTSVRNELTLIGARAAQMLIDKIDGRVVHSETIPPTLIIRESSRGVPPR